MRLYFLKLMKASGDCSCAWKQQALFYQEPMIHYSSHCPVII